MVRPSLDTGYDQRDLVRVAREPLIRPSEFSSGEKLRALRDEFLDEMYPNPTWRRLVEPAPEVSFARTLHLLRISRLSRRDVQFLHKLDRTSIGDLTERNRIMRAFNLDQVEFKLAIDLQDEVRAALFIKAAERAGGERVKKMFLDGPSYGMP